MTNITLNKDDVLAIAINHATIITATRWVASSEKFIWCLTHLEEVAAAMHADVAFFAADSKLIDRFENHLQDITDRVTSS